MSLSDTKVRFLIGAFIIIVVSIFAFRQPAIKSVKSNLKKPDFVFQNFSIQNFNGDTLESEVSASTAEIDKKTLRVSIEKPSTKIAPGSKNQIDISANSGQLSFLFNRFDFTNATVSLNFSNSPTVINANQVRYFPKENKINGENSVEVKNQYYSLKGQHFEVDTQARYLNVSTNVSAKIKPTP